MTNNLFIGLLFFFFQLTSNSANRDFKLSSTALVEKFPFPYTVTVAKKQPLKDPKHSREEVISEELRSTFEDTRVIGCA
jgi:hypothetical protein